MSDTLVLITMVCVAVLAYVFITHPTPSPSLPPSGTWRMLDAPYIPGIVSDEKTRGGAEYKYTLIPSAKNGEECRDQCIASMKDDLTTHRRTRMSVFDSSTNQCACYGDQNVGFPGAQPINMYQSIWTHCKDLGDVKTYKQAWYSPDSPLPTVMCPPPSTIVQGWALGKPDKPINDCDYLPPLMKMQKKAVSAEDPFECAEACLNGPGPAQGAMFFTEDYMNPGAVEHRCYCLADMYDTGNCQCSTSCAGPVTESAPNYWNPVMTNLNMPYGSRAPSIDDCSDGVFYPPCED